MTQEVIVYIIGVCALIYILWQVFEKKKKNSCNGCTACPKGDECAKKSDVGTS